MEFWCPFSSNWNDQDYFKHPCYYLGYITWLNLVEKSIELSYHEKHSPYNCTWKRRFKKKKKKCTGMQLSGQKTWILVDNWTTVIKKVVTRLSKR